MSEMLWSAEFTDRSVRRTRQSDPNWAQACRLDPAVVRSLQKFQVGESGDGANLIVRASSTGDPDYEEAVRLFVAEEQNHARMLAELLRAAGAPTIGAHWTDRVFMWSRRLMGLRLELMVLAIAEIVALRYYRALAEDGNDALLTDVAERILDDEQFHVPFQCRRLVVEFDSLPKRTAAPSGMHGAFSRWGSSWSWRSITGRRCAPAESRVEHSSRTHSHCSTTPWHRCSRATSCTVEDLVQTCAAARRCRSSVLSARWTYE